MADELELPEVEILKSRIRRLESKNQDLLQENERLISTVAHLEATKSHLDSSNHLLLRENERLQSIVSDLHKAKSELAEELETLTIDFRDREKSLELENLFTRTRLDDLAGNQTAIDEKSEQIERLLSEIKELKRNYDEEGRELRQVVRKKAELAKENGRLENKIDRITEDNTVVILSLLTAQSDLETDLKKQTEIIRSFFQGALLMVRKTVEMLEGRGKEEMNGGDFAEGSDQGTYSTVEMLLRSLEVELMGVKKAFWKRIAGNKCSAHPKAKTFRRTPFPHYDSLKILCGTMAEGKNQKSNRAPLKEFIVEQSSIPNTSATNGSQPSSPPTAVAPSLEHIEGSNSSSDNIILSTQKDFRIKQPPCVATSLHRKRKRTSVCEKIAESISKMDASFDRLSVTSQPTTAKDPYEICLEELQTLEDLDEETMLRAVDFLQQRQNAIAFLTLKGPLRMRWLRNKYGCTTDYDNYGRSTNNDNCGWKTNDD